MAYPKEVIEQIKTKILEETAAMRRYNETIEVSGTRGTIKSEDREIPYVWYGAPAEEAPLILGFHGGGYLFGGAAMNDPVWKRTAEKLGCHVASIDYRMSPDYQYREAVDDAYDAAKYFLSHADEFHIKGNKLTTMGMSAGGNLAAAVCIYAAQKGEDIFERQIPLYPMLDAYTDPDSKGNGSLGGPVMYIFNELHSPESELKNPLVSPVFAEDELLAKLPHAIVSVAENDNLRKEGELYVERLNKNGVRADCILADGMPHGYFESGFGEPSEFDVNFLGEQILALIKDGTMNRKSEETLDFILENW